MVFQLRHDGQFGIHVGAVISTAGIERVLPPKIGVRERFRRSVAVKVVSDGELFLRRVESAFEDSLHVSVDKVREHSVRVCVIAGEGVIDSFDLAVRNCIVTSGLHRLDFNGDFAFEGGSFRRIVDAGLQICAERRQLRADRIVVNGDFYGAVVGINSRSDSLIVCSLECLFCRCHVVAGYRSVRFFQSSVPPAFAVSDSVQIYDCLHCLIAVAVDAVGVVFHIIIIVAVDKGIRRRGTGENVLADIRPVDAQGDAPPEVFQGKNAPVALAVRFNGLQGL